MDARASRNTHNHAFHAFTVSNLFNKYIHCDEYGNAKSDSCTQTLPANESVEIFSVAVVDMRFTGFEWWERMRKTAQIEQRRCLKKKKQIKNSSRESIIFMINEDRLALKLILKLLFSVSSELTRCELIKHSWNREKVIRLHFKNGTSLNDGVWRNKARNRFRLWANI